MTLMVRLWSAFFALTLAASAQVQFGHFQNRDAWVVQGSKLRLTILQSGGHLAQMVLREDPGVSPLWVQSRPTIEPDTYDAVRHEKLYGGGSGARLMSGLAGHNVCFPFWGNPSESEARAGMTFHGETGVVRWRLVEAGDNWLTVAAELPQSKTRFTRKLRLRGQVASFEETAENQSGWDRPVGWCEHVTLGPPFLERGVTEIQASLTRGYKDSPEAAFAWPEGMAEAKIDLRTVRNQEGTPGFVNHFLVDPSREYGFFSALHPGKRILVGYIFPRAEFPWLNIWEANTPEMLTRGMEFSDTPIHGTMRALMGAPPRVWDAATYEWLDGKGRLTKHYRAFLTRVPEGWRGVAEVRPAGDALEIVERETGKVLRVE